MHIEVQVALNFVISYLYNKLPRRRVNIFGEELEKALKDKFQGHWYPEKPFKGSAFRCLKTGDPIDAVLERAARESGVPINDILENLPNELSVWVDPGEVSYRIGEKGAVKILYSENGDNHEENNSADREVTKTFNPEAQCFRPIDIVNSSMNSLSLSPKTSPLAAAAAAVGGGSSPLSAASTSPTYKGSPNPATAANGAGGGAAVAGAAAGYMPRTQAPLTFTTATFAQTKFGSTKLKTSSKRANSSSSYRMSPTEFSNYIKQRAIQQQLHHVPTGNNVAAAAGANIAAPPPNHFGPIGPISPARSLSPNPLNMTLSPTADPFYFPSMSMGIYSHAHRNLYDGHNHADNNAGMFAAANGHRNLFDAHNHADNNAGMFAAGNGMQSKFNQYLDPNRFYGMSNGQSSPQQQHNGNANKSINAADNKEATAAVVADVVAASNNNNNGSNKPNNKTPTNVTVTISSASNDTPNNSTKTAVSPVPAAKNQQQQQDAAANSKLMDGINNFPFSNAAGNSYQQLLLAN